MHRPLSTSEEDFQAICEELELYKEALRRARGTITRKANFELLEHNRREFLRALDRASQEKAAARKMEARKSRPG